MLKAGNWVVVLGPRMVGKTSLIKAAPQIDAWLESCDLSMR